MSIIYSYPEETSLQGSDMLIGTSTALVGGKQKNITKNFTLDQLSSFIQGGEGVINPAASDFQIAVFNQSGAKLTGSIMSQDVYPNGTGITVSGNLSTTGNLVAPGTVTLGSGSNLIDLTSTTKFGGLVQDSNGITGTVNQILLTNNSGKLVWANYTAGLTYQGLWDANNNDPGLSSSVGVNSTFYIVGTAGNEPLNGNTDWQVGDWAIFVGTTGAGGVWQKIDNTSSITGNGTVNRMVMWSSNFTVTDGPLLDSSGTNVLSILDRSIIPSVSNTRSLGSSSLKWNMLYVNDIETTNINILSHVDLNSLPGTPGQVLTSSGVGAPAVWTTPTTGTITGAGTTNKIPLWTNNVAIGDSILTQLNAATPFTDTYLSVGSGGVSTTGLKVDGFFVDSTGSKGTAGQILSSTGTATLWKTGEDSSVTYSLAAGAQDGSSVPINLTDSLAVTTPVKITGGTNVSVVRTSDTEITLSSTDTNTTYDFGSSTSGSDVLLNLVGTPADNSSVKLIGSGVTIAQTNDEVTFTVPAGDTYDLNAGVKSGTSVPLNLTSGSGTDNSVVNLTEGTGITLTQTSATEITIAGVAQGVTGSGTVNKLPKFDTTTSLTDSLVSETAGTAAMTFEKDGSPNPSFETYSLNAFNQDTQRVATVDFSSDPFGPGQVMQTFEFSTTDASLMASFRSKYSIPAGTDLGNPGNRDATSFAQNTTFTFTFDNNATITFTQPAGPIALNTTTATGNNVSLGVVNVPNGPIAGGTYGTQLQYVSGSGSITDGAVLTVVEAQAGGITVAGELDMSTANKIINLAQPTASQDAATKAYVDSSNIGSITGSGTVNKLPKFGTTDSLTDSLVSEVPASSPSSYTADNTFFVEPVGQFLIMAVPRRIRWLRSQDINAFPTLTFPPNSVTGTGVFVLTGDIILDADGTDVITAGTYNVDLIAGVSGGVWNSVELTFSASDWLQAAGVSGNVSYANGGAVTSLVATIGAVTDAEIEIAAKLDMTTKKIVNVGQPTANQDAATKAYVDDVVTGQLVFQTGYDAVNNSPNLTTSPNSILKGWTYAVTNGPSTSFWNPPLNVGDLVIANIDNPTSVADWTEVQSNVGFAGSGATDGATVKGIAGFNSADFDVSNDGWVEAKDFTGTTPGYVPDATSAPTGTFLKEDGTWAVAGVGSVTNFSTVSTAYPGITTTVTNPTSTPELVLGLGANAAAGKYLDGGTGDWVTLPPPGTGTVTGTGSTNSVAFWSTSTALTSDANLYWDNTNDRLGIGTSSPAYPLEVQSGGAGTVLRAGTSFVSIDSTGSASSPSLIFNGDDNTGIFRPSTDTLAFSTAGAERIRLRADGGIQVRNQGIGNTYIGDGGTGNLPTSSTAYNNTAYGYQSLKSLTTSDNNTAVGSYALEKLTTGTDNTAVGRDALQENISGNQNVAVGKDALTNATSTTFNTALGYQAGWATTTGGYNALVGFRSGFRQTTAINNVSVGYLAGENTQTGNGNVNIGSNAGQGTFNTTNPSNSIYIGFRASIGSSDNTPTNEIVIGYDAIGNGDNSATYGNTSVTKHVFPSGKIGIGTINPAVSLDISATDAVQMPVGATGNRPTTGVSNGMLRYNSDALEFEGYSDGAWGAIGGGGASATITTQNAVGDGTNLTFALGATPNGGSSSFVDVFIDGVYQEISTYTISGTNLVFDAGNAPAAGTNVETKTTADYNVGAAVQTVNGASGVVSTKDIPVVKTNASPEAVATQNQHLYVLYGSAAVTLTLPSNPAAGDYIKISNLSTLTTNVVAQAASGERIMGTAANLTLDNATASFQLIYSGVSDPGWVVVGPA